MFQCNTLCRNTKCSLCSRLAKGYVPPVFRCIPCPCTYACTMLSVSGSPSNLIEIIILVQFIFKQSGKLDSIGGNYRTGEFVILTAEESPDQEYSNKLEVIPAVIYF